MIELTTREVFGWALAFFSAGALLTYGVLFWLTDHFGDSHDTGRHIEPERLAHPGTFADLHLAYAMDKYFTVRHLAWISGSGSDRRLYSLCSGTACWSIASWYGRVSPISPEEMRYRPICQHCLKAADL